jgi:hypothetical protein
MNDLTQRIAKLSPAKLEVLASRMKERRNGGARPLPAMARAKVGASQALSFAQERLWFLDQLEPGNPAYNISAGLCLRGILNAAALEQSLCEITRRHQVLRTTIASVEGRPLQIIGPAGHRSWPVVDLSWLAASERETCTHWLAKADARRAFDLARGPLLRVALARLSEAEHVVLLTMHHIVSDGWSMTIFLGELVKLYQTFSAGAPSRLPELLVQYADFAQWQRQWMQAEKLRVQLAYWKRQLADAPAVLRLPTDRSRPAVRRFDGATVSFKLSPKLSASVQELCQQEGVTLFMLLLAAFDALLHYYSGQEDILVGCPIANRTWTPVEGLIGMFANTLVLRADLSGNPSFGELLTRVREVCLGAYDHQDVPFEKLVQELHPTRGLSHTPIFQVAFALQNVPMTLPPVPGFQISQLKDESATPFDLILRMKETEQGLAGSWQYDPGLFDARRIARMSDHLERLLGLVVSQPATTLHAIRDTLQEADRRQQSQDREQLAQASQQLLKKVTRKSVRA